MSKPKTSHKHGTEESYYDILGVSKNATIEEIKLKRKELSKKYHPDKLPAEKREQGTERFKKITEAYEVLSDPEKRNIYDQHGKEGLKAHADGFNFNGGGFDPTEIFGDIFGKRKQQSVRVPPIQIRVNVTLEDVFTGKDFIQEIERFSVCNICDNTGFEDKGKHDCTVCKGSGFKMEMRQIGPGMIQQFQRPCNNCEGSGKDNKFPKCNKCNGKGLVEEKVKLSFKVEQGMCKGDIIEIKNEGHELPKDVPGLYRRGDVMFVVNEIPHETFKRGVVYDGKMNPANIAIEVELQLHEALCGFVRSFKYLDGTQMYIDNYDIVKDGDVKIIKNKGLPQKNRTYLSGDLFVKFKVTYPENIADNTKSKLFELLTGKKYNSSTVHKLPSDAYTVDMKDVKDYVPNDNYYDEDDDHQEGGVQCAQQ
ncbi:DnaJ chaperone protein [Fadolivirus algeromassiliense]|jgi:DnaJ family protein A protein 2|uniref:DnaJ chaperone protein n=1 Tax=Fadolivirus FV1/VV64 TaxID=3070911 RepID=A0A7D3QTZ6_9VIRU|nr:DnaJ chaperone protein [Fadolivirus algeromassiliense]QKF93745.1 DnaJ chaperone protein [Fadolivirus FV1/VV64]